MGLNWLGGLHLPFAQVNLGALLAAGTSKPATHEAGPVVLCETRG
jgi:hypothetical protein